MINTKKILLIEDEEAHAELVRRAFESMLHFELKVAECLHEAHEYLNSFKPDLVIADWKLPDGNGQEILKHCIDIIPVVIMTSHGSEKTAVDALKLGALDYVIKSTDTLADMPHTASRALREWNAIILGKKTEKALVESEEKFRSITNNLPIGIYRTDDDGRIIHVNPAMAQILFLDDVNHIIGQDIDSLLGIADLHDSDTLSFGTASTTELQIVGPENLPLWISDTRKAVYNDAGVIIYFDGYIENITQNKKDQEAINLMNHELEQLVFDRTSQLLEALEDLKYENFERRKSEQVLYKTQVELSETLKKERELNELKSRFISMVSHEYRTPLTVILSSTYILEKYFDLNKRENFVSHLGKIQSAVKSMTSLLEDILVFGRAESGRIHENLESMDLVAIVYEVIEDLKSLDRVNHKFLVTSEKQEILIDVDRVIFYHVISNLITNAMKYSKEESEIEIILELVERKVVICVADSGIGIPNDDATHIFEPFHRGRNVGTISGTGLGLAIVKQCIDMLKGKIRFESEVGKGSRFFIELPEKIANESIAVNMRASLLQK